MLQQDMDFAVKPKGKINVASLLPECLDLCGPVAKVDQVCTNDFQYLGQYCPVHQSTLLQWEEVLWLMEKRKLIFLSQPEEGHSVQFYFEKWLGACALNLSMYLVYSRLVSLGYVVWRPNVSYLQGRIIRGGGGVQPDFVVFCPNAQFSKKKLPQVDYFVHVCGPGTGVIDSVFGLGEAGGVVRLVAQVEAGNVNFLEVGFGLPCLELVCSKRKKLKTGP